ncbi:MAG: hypothetical protein ACOY3Y_17095 [Acidobacteriota bacterium]
MGNTPWAARMFQTSAKLETVAAWLRGAAKGEPPDATWTETLTWAGQLLPRLQLEGLNPAVGTARATDDIVHLTRARAAFYSSLLRLRASLVDAGLEAPNDVLRFLETLQTHLQTGGQGRLLLAEPLVDLAAELFHGFAEEMLNEMLASRPGPRTCRRFSSN